MLLIQAAKVTASERLYRNKLAVALANMRESPISETRATTKGGAELKFGTQSPPAKSLQTIGSFATKPITAEAQTPPRARNTFLGFPSPSNSQLHRLRLTGSGHRPVGEHRFEK